MPSEQDLLHIIDEWEQQQWKPKQYDINKLYVRRQLLLPVRVN